MPRKKSDLLRMQASVPGLDNASYLLANNQESAGRNLQWWRDAVAPERRYDDLLAEAGGHASGRGRGGVHAVADRRAVAGRRPQRPRRLPRRSARPPPAGHLTRAVLEGVALNATWLLGAAEKFVGSRLDDIRLVGGGARSDLWCQILADTSDRTIVRVTDPWLAGPARSRPCSRRWRWAPSTAARCAGWCPPTSRSGPTRGAATTYDALVRELPKLYAAQKGFFRRRSARG